MTKLKITARHIILYILIYSFANDDTKSTKRHVAFLSLISCSNVSRNRFFFIIIRSSGMKSLSVVAR